MDLLCVTRLVTLLLSGLACIAEAGVTARLVGHEPIAVGVTRLDVELRFEQPTAATPIHSDRTIPLRWDSDGRRSVTVGLIAIGPTDEQLTLAVGEETVRLDGVPQTIASLDDRLFSPVRTPGPDRRGVADAFWLAVLLGCGLIGSTLFRPRWLSETAVAAGCVVAVLWANGVPRLAWLQADVVMRTTDTERRDGWNWMTARQRSTHVIPLGGDATPIPASISQALRSAIDAHADGRPRSITTDLERGSAVVIRGRIGPIRSTSEPGPAGNLRDVGRAIAPALRMRVIEVADDRVVLSPRDPTRR